MEPITLMAIATFVAPYFHKAGEKIAENTIEALFESRKDIAEKFKGLFQTEIISLELNDASSPIQIQQKLESKPEIKQEIERKVVDNEELLNELVGALKQMPQLGTSGVTINAEKIAQVNTNIQSVSQTIQNF